MSFAYSIDRLRELVGADAECLGSCDQKVTGIASLAEAVAGDLSFLGNPKYREQVEGSSASVLLVPRDFEGEPKSGQLWIKLENPSFALALICRDIESTLLPKPAAGIHPTAYVEGDAEVDPSASVGAFCYVGSGAKVGAAVVLESHVSVGRSAVISANSYLFPQVIVSDYCVVGERNRLLQGSVLGADGYGYAFVDGAHQRIPQIGNVVTEADVDIGANSTIDRARFGTTLIGAGTKIDNQVQVGHNVRIGRCCLLVGQCGVSGSTELGDGVIVAGQAGIAGHLKIGAGAIIAGAAGVTKSIPAKSKVAGMPAESFILMNRIYTLQRKLPSLFKRFDRLEKTVESLATSSEQS